MSQMKFCPMVFRSYGKIGKPVVVGESLLCAMTVSNPGRFKSHFTVHSSRVLLSFILPLPYSTCFSIYRPPQTSLSQFIDDFTALIGLSCLGGCPVIITVDFNIHSDEQQIRSLCRNATCI